MGPSCFSLENILCIGTVRCYGRDNQSHSSLVCLGAGVPRGGESEPWQEQLRGHRTLSFTPRLDVPQILVSPNHFQHILLSQKRNIMLLWPVVVAEPSLTGRKEKKEGRRRKESQRGLG